ncbi:hypothetical protein MKW98_020834 [Papaver atlanticum]|uniref:Ascorbate peroxidase n=1 Tax=Papaver atlanticum TaxID=357466 RepID=A0AAD4XYF2_9MAGN|nr:hypothetical protein MKW98_020834 [Papaver atlanticum]
MGVSERDIVALSGGYTLGRRHKEPSVFEGPWTTNPLVPVLYVTYKVVGYIVYWY